VIPLEFVPLAFVPGSPRYEPLPASDAWAEFYAARAENAARLLAYVAALDARMVRRS
jgi:hypothetical protein